MEPAGQPSFIPHDAGTPSARRTSEGGLWDLLMMIGIVALAVSVALAAGVFLYQQYLKANINRSLERLAEARRQFDPSLVDQLTRLDNRMDAGDELLHAHIAPSSVFTVLDQITAQTVAYDSLDVKVVDPRNITLAIEGVARSVNSVAFQADLLSKSGVITNPIFSDLVREEDGVHFSLAALIDASKINFGSLVNTAVNAAGAAQPTTQPTESAQPIAPTASSSEPASPFGGAPQQTTP
ncbi:hypothetical protein C4568_03285 [Candidatus Parcubacteria bacterium]|nr:MAG: hypothetical protein C4568_03285 [Candidatus Parcubacteria bacterium]